MRDGRQGPAIEILVEAYGDPLTAFAARILRDSSLAEDVRQQVFQEALQGLSNFQGRSTLWSWLCGIAYHRCMNLLKQARRTRSMVSADDSDLLDALAGEPDTAMDEDRVAMRRALESCLGKLPARTRAQVLLRYLLGLSHQEIGELAGEPHGTVQVRMSRILPRLQDCLRGEGVAPMHERKPREQVKAAALADLPFQDEAKRAESEWLLARDADPGAPAPSPKIARDYEELEELLASLPSIASSERWHEEMVSAASALSRPGQRGSAWKWVAGGAVLVAAAAAAILWLRPHSSEPELEWAIHDGNALRRSGEVVVGNRLIVTARPRGAGDLRVYREDGVLMARCPQGPGCRTPAGADGRQVLELTLDAPVQYRVILVVGAEVALPESSKDAFVDAARAAGARIITPPPIDVH